jgi:hypothetical protein
MFRRIPPRKPLCWRHLHQQHWRNDIKYNQQQMSGWWFGTFFIFPYIGNNHPNWRTHIFQRDWNHQQMWISCFLTNKDADFSHERMDSIGSQLDLSDIHVEGVLIFWHEDSTARFCGKILSIQWFQDSNLI